MSKYKVFLADDEIVVREGIRSNFPWDDSPFVLAGEAPDGEIALNMMQDIKPDILITDIRMPFMDGLALSRVVKQTMPWVYIIIISGFDDFSYAKEAISIGVEEYLLKPVSGQELLQVLNRLALRIKKEKQRQDHLQAYKDHLASSGGFLKEKLLQNLFLGKEKEENIHGKARSLQMNLMANWYLVMLLNPFSKEVAIIDNQERLTAESILSRLSDHSRSTAYLCEMNPYFAYVVLGDTQADLEERAYGLAQAAQFEVARNTSIHFLVAIGNPISSVAHIPSSYKDAQEVMKEIEKVLSPRIMNRDDVINKESPHTLPDFSSMNLSAAPILEQLKYTNEENINFILTRYIKSMGDTAIQSPLFADYIYVDILRVASHIIKESGGEPQTVLSESFYEDEKPSSSSLLDLYEKLENLLIVALRFRNQNMLNHHGPIIRQAMSFLNENYMNSSLTLKDVASHVSLSNNHFCTVFSQETGVTYTEYLTNLRMSKAKKLLTTTTKRSSEIAYQVGYNDPHYFSYLFKKNVGTSPRDFRKKAADEGFL